MPPNRERSREAATCARYKSLTQTLVDLVAANISINPRHAQKGCCVIRGATQWVGDSAGWSGEWALLG